MRKPEIILRGGFAVLATALLAFNVGILSAGQR